MIKQMFASKGLSVSEWARQNQFSAILVHQVLNGKRKCLRGQSHDIAVALGLKEGSFVDYERKLKAESSESGSCG